MKKITVLFLCAALLAAASCGNNSNNNKGKSEEPKAATKAEAGKKMDIGDKFAFAGLESSKLVPACAKEISEMETPVRSESRPMKEWPSLRRFWTDSSPATRAGPPLWPLPRTRRRI